ncbi:MAG: hypothetical protein JXQ83_11500, partial [Candidatus Glassbacteria bacterium]|nr:hypothetical protein [Candidatus Glassbacteria bacterium]
GVFRGKGENLLEKVLLLSPKAPISLSKTFYLDLRDRLYFRRKHCYKHYKEFGKVGGGKGQGGEPVRKVSALP